MYKTDLFRLCTGIMIQIFDDELHQIQHFKRPILGKCVRHSRNGIRHPKCIKTGTITSMRKSLPAFFGKHSMTDKSMDTCSTSFLECFATFIQSSSCLYQIIDNDNILSLGIAILDHNCPHIVFSSSFATNNDMKFIRKESRKTLCGTVIGKCNTIDIRLFDAILEQRNGCLQRRN